MYTRDDIIEALRKASREVTDDCQMAGILTAGALILGVSEDTVNSLIADRTYIPWISVRKLWNDYAVGFEYPDGTDVMCQDSGWTYDDARRMQEDGDGKWFVEGALTGKWSRTANPVNGTMMYAVYRLKDITKVDGGENREILTKYTTNKECMEQLAEELNIRGCSKFDDAAGFALDFLANYVEFEPWEILPNSNDTSYTVIRCAGCADEDEILRTNDKELCEKVVRELNGAKIADHDTAVEVVKKKQAKSFIGDPEKMVDFFFVSRSAFLETYSYVTEQDYDETCYDILERAGYEANLVEPEDMNGFMLHQIVDGLQKWEWLLSRGGDK